MEFTLTDEQQAVVNHPLPNHARILAGPGTGKSATAVALAEHWLNAEEPPRVKFITFTRAATAELGKKLSSANSLRQPIVPSTLHSFAISVLKKNPGCAAFPTPIRMATDTEWDFLKKHLSSLTHLSAKRIEDLKAAMAAKWQSMSETDTLDFEPEERARFTSGWQAHRRVFGYVDISELPELLRQALRDHADICRNECDVLVVDEYQDLNACDLEIIQRLAGRGVSVIAIGDDDQSIYSFRHANPVGIREFPTRYGTECDYKLTICHRSPRRIVDWAQHVILGDLKREHRPAPQCNTDRDDSMTALLAFDADNAEAQGVVRMIQWLREQRGVGPEDIIVLCRSSRQGAFTKNIKQELTSLGIPITDAEEFKLMMKEDSNRQLMARLRLVNDRNDSVALLTLIGLTEGFGPKVVEALFDYADENKTTFGRCFWEQADRAFLSLPVGKNKNTAMYLYQWSQELQRDLNLIVSEENASNGWGHWIMEKMEAGLLPSCTPSFAELLVSIDEVIKDVPLDVYLSQIQQVGKELIASRSNGVRFMSMTSSKGLTARATIVVGVDDDVIPKPTSNIDEERRLLYVAMTRSQEYLFLTWCAQRHGTSRFSGSGKKGRRQHCRFLDGGPVESTDGKQFLQQLSQFDD